MYGKDRYLSAGTETIRNYAKPSLVFHSVAGFNMPRLSTFLICWTMAADLLKLSSAMRWWNAWSSAEVLTPDESGDSRKQPSFAPVHLPSFAHVKACEGLLKASDPSSKMKSMTQRNACGSYVIEESWHENCSQLSASDLCIDYTDWKAISGLSLFVPNWNTSLHAQPSRCCFDIDRFMVFCIHLSLMSSWSGSKWLPVRHSCIHLGMDQYLLIPFLGAWTSIYQLFWCSPGVQGFDTLPFG